MAQVDAEARLQARATGEAQVHASIVTASDEDRSALRLLTTVSVIFVVVTAILYVCTISWVEPIPRDATTLVVGRDFLNFWMYGRAAWTPDPGRFYDPRLYWDALDGLLGAGYPGQNWSYPPPIMLFAAPFGRLPYLPALACWTLLGLGAFIPVTLRRVGTPRLLLPLLLSPAAVFCLLCGQSSLLTAAMLLTIFANLDRRPLLAGILIGLLTLKPQLGLLFPVMLAASGRWRVFAAATVTFVLLAAAAAVLFGVQAWSDFVLEGIPVQNVVLTDPLGLTIRFYPTIFTNLRGIGVGYGPAMAVQACFSAAAVAAVCFAFRFRKDADPPLLAALFLACSVSAVPYLLSYDLLALTVAAVTLLAEGKLDAPGRILVKLVYWLPLIQMALGQFHVPGPALIAPAFAAYVLLRLASAGAPQPAWTRPVAVNHALPLS